MASAMADCTAGWRSRLRLDSGRGRGGGRGGGGGCCCSTFARPLRPLALRRAAAAAAAVACSS